MGSVANLNYQNHDARLRQQSSAAPVSPELRGRTQGHEWQLDFNHLHLGFQLLPALGRRRREFFCEKDSGDVSGAGPFGPVTCLCA